jgi:hypothetical protein
MEGGREREREGGRPRDNETEREREREREREQSAAGLLSLMCNVSQSSAAHFRLISTRMWEMDGVGGSTYIVMLYVRRMLCVSKIVFICVLWL